MNKLRHNQLKECLKTATDSLQTVQPSISQTSTSHGPALGAPLPGRNEMALLTSLPPNYEISEGKPRAISAYVRVDKGNVPRRRKKTRLGNDYGKKEAQEKM
uniref:CLLU1 antisense RNA 1 n=1 Tax=Macaca nemestrina TaxID=9545 RepID=A0A2K6BUN1_MACNE|nr:putative chronic lymphocytic leukemia up-regulated protein 1 opposite strand transcript protein [Macaca nemestrina]